ncbi:hypothetical protein QE404_001842 [Chryseobacterium camelliae]|uniref:Uncharacterized protein n=1 Tax=Chryseobacterium camelliae TaxID=1265445 RepID=A0ABU0TK75_9FLAO|nr:hypothetical protein [Chryseobacterium camelliae]
MDINAAVDNLYIQFPETTKICTEKTSTENHSGNTVG